MGDSGGQEQRATQKAGVYKPALQFRRRKADCEKLRMDSEGQGRPMLSATHDVSRPNRGSEPKTALAGALPS